MSFTSFALSSDLQNAIVGQGFITPTPIQCKVIPVMLAGQDVLATAQTGSGKTAAFCLPILERYQQTCLVQVSKNTNTTPELRKQRTVQTLILVPTRELAVQVGDILQQLGKTLPHPAKLAILFGGISINPQMMHLRGGADIVVATPGRLLDLHSKNAISLAQVSCLILDEADKMLALGFADELQQILALLPAKKQSGFFSATFEENVQILATSMLHQPQQISIENTLENRADIAQRAIVVEASQRTQLLKHLFVSEKWPRALVFVATKYAADLVADKLRRARISAEAFHGEQTQGKRSQVIADFKAARVKVVIATDVAARGLDISQLPVVVNYDLPRSSDDYVHRIGRTGRAGESGMAINFICADGANEAHFRLIEKRHNIALQRETIAGFEPSAAASAQAEHIANATLQEHDVNNTDSNIGGMNGENGGNGGVKGKRPNKKDKIRAAQQDKLST